MACLVVLTFLIFAEKVGFCFDLMSFLKLVPLGVLL